MRKLAIGAAIFVGLGVAYILIHLALIEVGQEIVILHRRTGDGELSMARLWVVDEGEFSWLHHGYADAPWIRQLEVEPIVEISRGGVVRQYRALPDRAADPQVHRLLREKYGLADRLVRLWVGTDTDSGLVTGSPCMAVPVRLDSSLRQ